MNNRGMSTKNPGTCALMADWELAASGENPYKIAPL
jgi:hypothetical protein